MKIRLSILLLLLSFSVFSQTNFVSGYVVANSNDTLRGFVDYQERSENPVSVFFKSDLNAATQVFTVDNCAGYGIEGAGSFHRFLVDISLSQVQLDRLKTGVDLSKKRETVFLEQLHAGSMVSLFRYNDKIKERFYILKSGEQAPVELIQHIFLNKGGTEKVATKRYINQLQLLMRDLGKADAVDQQTLLRLNYDKWSLLGVVSKINNDQLQKKRSPHAAVRLFAGVGVGFNNFVHHNGSKQIGPSPMVSIGVDLFSNPAIRKLVFRAELSRQSSKVEVSGQGQETLIYRQWIIEAMPHLIYNMYNTDKLKFFFGLGAGLMYHRNKKQSDFLPVPNHVLISQTSAVSMRGTLGVVLYKKLEIGAGYNSIAFGGKSGYIKHPMQHFRMGVNYLFGK